MSQDFLEALILCETDIDGALNRFYGNEELYSNLLLSFLKDKTLEDLKKSIDEQNWDDAFTAAHALKGLAGNLGFVPLFHSTGELVMMIRAGKISEVNDSYRNVVRCYDDISSVIISNKDKIAANPQRSEVSK